MSGLKLYIMCGLAFSGKSTLAKKLAEHTGSKLVAFDKVWIEKDKEKPVPKDAEGWRYIRDLAQQDVLNFLKSGHSVVYDDNNPRQEHRGELRKVAQIAGAEAVVVYLDTPFGVIRMRQEANKTTKQRHDVEQENFEKVMKDLEIPNANENTLILKPEMDIEEFLKGLSK